MIEVHGRRCSLNCFSGQPLIQRGQPLIQRGQKVESGSNQKYRPGTPHNQFKMDVW